MNPRKLKIRRSKDRYNKYKKSGYLFVGSAVTGLPILKKEFAMYPPYFDIFSCQNNYEREIKQLESNNWIREIITAAAISNDTLFYLMKMYVASFVYRSYFLKRILHQICAVRCTVFRTTNIPSAPFVRMVFPW